MFTPSEQKIEIQQLVKFFSKNKKILLTTVLLALIASITLTYLMPKKYKSYGVVFPPSNNSLEFGVENPNFGYDVEADRLIQIFQSNDVRDSVIKKFDLLNYFKIDKANVDYAAILNKEYSDAVTFERTPAMSVVIIAKTKEPELSANIVNFVIDKTSQIREKIYKQNTQIAFNESLKSYNALKLKNDSLLLCINIDLKKHNLSNLMLLASSAQLNLDLNTLLAIKGNTDSSDLAVNIINFKHLNNRLNETSEKLFKMEKLLKTPISSIYIVNKGEVSFKNVNSGFLKNALLFSVISLFVCSVILLFKK